MQARVVESRDSDVIDNADDTGTSWRSGANKAGVFTYDPGFMSTKLEALQERLRQLIADAVEEPATIKERLVLPELQVVSELRHRSH